jgi:hypothetical protein
MEFRELCEAFSKYPWKFVSRRIACQEKGKVKLVASPEAVCLRIALRLYYKRVIINAAACPAAAKFLAVDGHNARTLSIHTLLAKAEHRDESDGRLTDCNAECCEKSGAGKTHWLSDHHPSQPSRPAVLLLETFSLSEFFSPRYLLAVSLLYIYKAHIHLAKKSAKIALRAGDARRHFIINFCNVVTGHAAPDMLTSTAGGDWWILFTLRIIFSGSLAQCAISYELRLLSGAFYCWRCL